MSTPHIAAVLLNWRNSADTLACLAQLAAEPYPRLSIVVVDNGSGDGSAERIRAAHPDLPLVESPVNRGFAGGVNQGLQYAAALGADYALLLNSDVRVPPGTIAALAAAAEADPLAGVLGPKVYRDAAARQLSFYGFRVTRGGVRPIGWNEQDRGQHDNQPVDAIPGCCMLIARRALLKAGLMDDRFFFYFEDVDYCLRVADAGLHVRVAPGAAIEHELGGSTRRDPARRQQLLGENRARFLRKHRRRFSMPLLAAGELRELANQLRAAARLGAPAAAGYVRGMARGLAGGGA